MYVDNIDVHVHMHYTHACTNVQEHLASVEKGLECCATCICRQYRLNCTYASHTHSKRRCMWQVSRKCWSVWQHVYVDSADVSVHIHHTRTHTYAGACGKHRGGSEEVPQLAIRLCHASSRFPGILHACTCTARDQSRKKESESKRESARAQERASEQEAQPQAWIQHG